MMPRLESAIASVCFDMYVSVIALLNFVFEFNFKIKFFFVKLMITSKLKALSLKTL